MSALKQDEDEPHAYTMCIGCSFWVVLLSMAYVGVTASIAEFTVLTQARSGSDIVDASYWEGHFGSGAVTRLVKDLSVDTTSIILHKNRPGKEGMHALSNMLKTNQNLLVLDLRSCDIGPAGVTALANGLQENSVLQQLDLTGNPRIGNKGGRAIAEAASIHKGLRKLGLAACGLETSAVAAIAEALGSNAGLRVLDLGDDPRVESSALVDLAVACQQHPKLERCSFGGRTFTGNMTGLVDWA